MNINNKEHDDLMVQFERDMEIKGPYLHREPKELWPKGYVYGHGETNKLFLAYRMGYSFGRAI